MIQPIPYDSTNIESIHDSANICAIEKILTSTVHSTVPTLPIFLYGRASDLPSPLHESSAESVTHKGNPKPRANLPNMIPNVPDEPDSE